MTPVPPELTFHGGRLAVTHPVPHASNPEGISFTRDVPAVSGPFSWQLLLSTGHIEVDREQELGLNLDYAKGRANK